MNVLVEDTSALPAGCAPQPITIPHFPDALHAVVWRNWDVVRVDTLAEVLRATPEEITALADGMGLPPQRYIPADELKRNYMTVLRRNWHLLPYEQLCQILNWTAAEMQFSLNEDDFLWAKLGGYKPQCEAVHYREPDVDARAHAGRIAEIVRDEICGALHAPADPLFQFITRFGEGSIGASYQRATFGAERFQFSVVYPYFLRYGDPLRGSAVADIPDGYLAELAACGVKAVWIQAVLNTLYPWEYAPELAADGEERISNLNLLVDRCRDHCLEVMLYFNEPRAMPRSFFERHPELRGTEEAPDRTEYAPDVVALCTSTKPVQDFLVNAVRYVFTQVPGLGGAFAITFSENLTNCYSREYDQDPLSDETAAWLEAQGFQVCPRCAARGPEAVNAEVCTLLERGMREAGSSGKFILYAWCTPEAWLPGIVDRLPESTWLTCISEWGKEFTRGDYSGRVNEYSISVVGPSDQSLRQWQMAKDRGLRIAAKMQAANTYEFSSIPYIPALRLVAQHLANVADAGIEGILLGWTAGGAPSPNLELVAEFAREPRPTVQQALLTVAARRFGEDAAPQAAEAWNILSDAYEEFPFDISVCYAAPQSLGPANLLFAEPSGFRATMSTFPYDDLKAWRGPYSEQTLQGQFEKVAERWKDGVELLNTLRHLYPSPAMEDEWRIAQAAYIHFRSTANQIHYVRIRGTESEKENARKILQDEINLSLCLIELVAEDSRIGFEASNHYGYTRFDLAEKILNCRNLLEK